MSSRQKRDFDPRVTNPRMQDATVRNPHTTSPHPTHEPDSLPSNRDAIVPVLVVLSGVQVGERLNVGSTVLLGRDPTCDFVLRDPAVSWRHLLLVRDESNVRVRDLGSRHGTRVSGVVIGEEVQLSVDDLIEIGDTNMRVELHDAVEQAFDREVVDRLVRDDLTGLMSRRKFELELDGLTEVALLRKLSLAVFALDIDGLKRINDTLGHLAGAETIARVGRRLGELIEGRGLVARTGGDEFLAAIPGVSRNEALELARGFVRAVGMEIYTFGETVVKPQISIGISTLFDDGRAANALVRAADDALLRAKRRGGGCASE